MKVITRDHREGVVIMREVKLRIPKPTSGHQERQAKVVTRRQSSSRAGDSSKQERSAKISTGSADIKGVLVSHQFFVFLRYKNNERHVGQKHITKKYKNVSRKRSISSADV